MIPQTPPNPASFLVKLFSMELKLKKNNVSGANPPDTKGEERADAFNANDYFERVYDQ